MCWNDYIFQCEAFRKAEFPTQLYRMIHQVNAKSIDVMYLYISWPLSWMFLTHSCFMCCSCLLFITVSACYVWAKPQHVQRKHGSCGAGHSSIALVAIRLVTSMLSDHIIGFSLWTQSTQCPVALYRHIYFYIYIYIYVYIYIYTVYVFI